MLPFNPSSELARAANPELDLVGGYQHRSEADSSQFLISAETGIVHLVGLGRLGVSRIDITSATHCSAEEHAA
jgi:hypothetical protein